MDKVLLEEELKKSGLRSGFIVDKLGISPQAYCKKKNGSIRFTFEEIKILRDLMGWTDNQVCKIFLD